MRYFHMVMSSKGNNRTLRSRSLDTTKSSPIKKRARRSKKNTPPATPESSVDEVENQPGTSSQNMSTQVIPIQGTLEESPFFTANPFQVLSNTQNEQMEAVPIPSEPKPPPIFVRNIKNFQLMCQQLNNIVGSGKYVCQSRTNDTKLMPDTPDTYRKIVKYLSDTKADYHTYQLRQERALRVVIRRLHPSTPLDAIKEELTEMGFRVRQIVNIFKEDREQPGTKNKIPLPLFFVDLDRTPQVEDIYKVTRLYYTSVVVEKPYTKRDIVQCHNCQAYGHTKRYCHHIPRCVRCGDQHKTEDCQKSRRTPAVCALCHQGHPANYKGCQTYKELKARIYSAPREERPSRPPRQPSRTVNTRVSYAQMFKGDTAPTQTQALPQEPQPRVFTSQPQDPYPISEPRPNNQAFIPPPPNATDLTSLLTSFLSEFRSLITPLISLLTNVVSNLIPLSRNP